MLWCIVREYTKGQEYVKYLREDCPTHEPRELFIREGKYRE